MELPAAHLRGYDHGIEQRIEFRQTRRLVGVKEAPHPDIAILDKDSGSRLRWHGFLPWLQRRAGATRGDDGADRLALNEMADDSAIFACRCREPVIGDRLPRREIAHP